MKYTALEVKLIVEEAEEVFYLHTLRRRIKIHLTHFLSSLSFHIYIYILWRSSNIRPLKRDKGKREREEGRNDEKKKG